MFVLKCRGEVLLIDCTDHLLNHTGYTPPTEHPCQGWAIQRKRENLFQGGWNSKGENQSYLLPICIFVSFDTTKIPICWHIYSCNSLLNGFSDFLLLNLSCILNSISGLSFQTEGCTYNKFATFFLLSNYSCQNLVFLSQNIRNPKIWQTQWVPINATDRKISNACFFNVDVYL